MLSPITVVYILFVSNILHHVASNIIDCSRSDSCSSSTISCDANEDCNILCNEADICNSKIFICPKTKNKQCNIYCTDNSCLHTKFDASNSNGTHLKLFLRGHSDTNVWSYGSLHCPPNGDCSIVSTNDNIQHNYITALNSNSLNITILNGDSRSNTNILYESDIFCPINDQIYCDINIYNGILSNANIYTLNIQYLWIVCQKGRNCYNTKQISTIYCGETYINKCNIISENTFLNCMCDNPKTTPDQYTTNKSINIRYSESNNSSWDSKKNLYAIIITLSSVILLTILFLCAIGIYFKMRTRSSKSENKPSRHRAKAYEHCNKHINNNLQVTSLVTPSASSMASGVSSLKLTVNNLFGKDKIIKKRVYPPTPPIPVAQHKTVSEFEIRKWSVEYECVDESDGYSYGDRNNSNKQNVLVSAPGELKCKNITIESDSDANFMSLMHGSGIRDRGLTDIPKIPLDGIWHGESIVKAQVKNFGKHVKNDSDANSVSASGFTDYTEINDMRKENWSLDNIPPKSNNKFSVKQMTIKEENEEEGDNEENVHIIEDPKTEYYSNCESDSNQTPDYDTENEGGDKQNISIIYNVHNNM